MNIGLVLASRLTIHGYDVLLLVPGSQEGGDVSTMGEQEVDGAVAVGGEAGIAGEF